MSKEVLTYEERLDLSRVCNSPKHKAPKTKNFNRNGIYIHTCKNCRLLQVWKDRYYSNDSGKYPWIESELTEGSRKDPKIIVLLSIPAEQVERKDLCQLLMRLVV